ncbi:hypothetical protein [Streptomyces anulatus]|uniref:hypothetical protein n=2 Tax=Streptomyces TaxID=1883 RepID=UPI00372114D0
MSLEELADDPQPEECAEVAFGPMRPSKNPDLFVIPEPLRIDIRVSARSALSGMGGMPRAPFHRELRRPPSGPGRRRARRRKEHEMAESALTPPAKSGLLVAVEELTAVHDRYDSLRSDNQGSSGDSPWPGGDGNLNDIE